MWVGYPDELKPMETEFNGQPVAGGTYPAAIWKTFVEAARSYKEYAPRRPRRRTTRPPPPRRRRRRRPARPRPRRPRRRPRTARRPARAAARPPEDTAPQDTAPEEPGAPPAEQQPPAEPDTGTGGATAPAGLAVAPRSPGGQGRDTLREPTAQKRHSSSAALVIPIRVPATISTSSQPGGRGPMRSGPASDVGAVEAELDRRAPA